MADKKITDLVGATVPLSGSEVSALVQGASTKQVPVREIAKFGYQDVATDNLSASTFALTDIGTWIRTTTSSVKTVPANSSVAFSIGTTLNGVQASTGQISFVAASGVTINVPSDCNAKTRAKGACWCLIKVASDSWDLVGDLEAA